MNIYVLDPDDINILAVVNNYSASSWNKVWSESGQFTLWAPITPENREFLVKENLIWPDNQLCVGVIEAVHKYTSEDGMPLMEVSGRFSESAYLTRRIIWGNVLRTESPAGVIRHIIRTQSIYASDLDRRLGAVIQDDLTIDLSVPEHENITYCNSYGNLWEEVKGLCLEYGLHMEFRYYKTYLRGVIFAASDRSSTVNLSTDLGFLTDSNYLWDSTDYCNAALVAGEGEGAARTTTTIIPTETLRDRRELYVDARDLQKTSASTQDPMTTEEYIAALQQRGQTKLTEHPIYESYDCSLQLTGEEGYIFGEDYNLGDKVTLTDSVLGLQVQAIVKEHRIDEDQDGRTDTLVFGVSIPTITELVRRRN